MSARDAAIGGTPTVQLLPPEVGQRARAARQLRTALSVLVVVAVIAGLGFGWSFWQNLQAQTQLADARAETSRLLAEQQEYADVQAALGVVTDVETIEKAATAYEVLWSQRIDEILVAVTAASESGLFGLSKGIELQVTPPWRDPDVSTNPLVAQPRAQMSLSFLTESTSEAAEFVRAIEKLDWVAGVRVTTVSSGGGFVSDMVIFLTDTSYSGRFAEGAEEPADGSTTTQEEDTE